jgi:protein TonB
VDVATGPRTAKVYQPGRLAVAPAAPTGKTARPKGTNWNCAFPPEADADDIDRAVVVVSVLIAADGKARDVKLVADPGHGFGRAARHCVLTREYEPARDAGDAAIDSRITLRVVFTR